MTRARLLGALVVVVALAWWWHDGDDDDATVRDDETTVDADHATAAITRHRGGNGGGRAGNRRDQSEVAIGGLVYVTDSHDPVANVEVVFRGAAGEASAMTGEDGRYHITLPRGVYRAFVRDDKVLSVGAAVVERLPTDPSADSANAPDEATMPIVTAYRDLDGVDLGVVLGGVLRGRVVDRAGRPIRNAVLRAVSAANQRPALGTDVAETDEHGSYELRLPAGSYAVRAAHSFYAGSPESIEVDIEPGAELERDITLVAGCVVAGRVVHGDGKPAGDGAIERRDNEAENFLVDGKIQPDGTFRFAVTVEGDLTLRAWPWKSPASAPQTFPCREGARFANVVFEIPRKGPDLAGVLVDASGAPVPMAFLDIEPLDEGGMSQQERSDASGAFGVFDLPAGRYRIKAIAPDRGVAVVEVESPSQNVKLALRGTGTLAGTTVLADGTFELQLTQCSLDGAELAIPEARHLVTVVDHHFELEGVPACELAVRATWKTQSEADSVEVAPGGVGTLELQLGPRVAKHVTGRVTTADGRAVEGVYVVATVDDEEAHTTTDATGRYELDTFAGARIIATFEEQVGAAMISTDPGDREQVDLRLEAIEYGHGGAEPEPDIIDEDW